MSTRNETDGREVIDEPTLPPEWQARPGSGRLRVVAWTPPERHQWVRATLTETACAVEFVGSLDELTDAGADMVIVSHDLLDSEPSEARVAFLSSGWAGPEPIRVIIDAPCDARVRYQDGGVEIAVGPETSERELGSRICALLRRAQMERDRNTLTGLPGNRALRRHLAKTLDDGRTVALVMADIDQFKAFNDAHGHLAGDALIALLADALREAAQTHEAFLAHVGGDDFAVVCRPGAAEEIAGAAQVEFSRRRTQMAGGARPRVTIVGTTVAPGEAERLEGVFQRLARLRREARGG